MSTAAAPKTIAPQTVEASLDCEWARGLMPRWAVAEEYVRFLDVELLPSGHALRQLIDEDLPKMTGELARLLPHLFGTR